jgi:hypothetical protein
MSFDLARKLPANTGEYTRATRRLSDFFEWNSVMHLDDDANKDYQRVGGAAENKVGTGLITLSDP